MDVHIDKTLLTLLSELTIRYTTTFMHINKFDIDLKEAIEKLYSNIIELYK